MINRPIDKLKDLVNGSSRQVKDESWLKDELYAIDYLGIAEKFLDLLSTGNKCTNPSNSSVAYVIGITDEEPTDYPGSLMIHQGRVSPPDVDMDFDDRYRNKVIEYAKDKYGEDRVAHIATFSSVKAKSAIRDAARVLDFDYSTGDKLAKLVPPPKLGIDKTLKEALENKDFFQAYQDPNNKKIVDLALGLEGVVRQSGMHAAGVVVARSDVTDYLPVMKKTDKDGEEQPLITQWDMNRVEEFGLLKIDFLGLRNLGVMDMCLENIKETRGFDLNEYDIPLDDELTFEQLRAGHALGTFQLESRGLRQIMVELQPENIKDIMALVALYRPGPLGSGMHKTYIARRHGRDTRMTNVDKVLLDLLPAERGILLYQESVIKAVRELAGFSAAAADTLRKGVGKKISEVVKKVKPEFLEGAERVGIISRAEAEELFTAIEYHAGYSFSLSHAASYGLISYWTSYLKFNYPAEYMAALLSSLESQDKAGVYLSECRRMGIRVVPPSINDSRSMCRVTSPTEIQFGLNSIRGIGPAIVKMILDARGDSRYSSIYDFMRNTHPGVLNKATLEHLFRSGSMDELTPQVSDRTISRHEKSEVLDAERNELGLFLTEHPLLGVDHILEPDIDAKIEELEDLADGSYVNIGGIISVATKKITKRGDVMYVLELEDLTGDVEIVVFPNMVKDNEFRVGEVVVIKGKLEHEGDDEFTVPKIFFFDISYPKLPDFASGEPIILYCDTVPDYGKVKQAMMIAEDNPGDCIVYLKYPDRHRNVTVKFKKPTHSSVKKQLEEALYV